jgi:hypothetical protein
MMRRPARLEPGQARGNEPKNPDSLSRLIALVTTNASRRVDAMNLKDQHDQIKSNGRDRRQIGDTLFGDIILDIPCGPE